MFTTKSILKSTVFGLAIIASSHVAAKNVYGTSGDDTLLGTSNNDFLVGWNGADLIRGFGGHDYIVGGNGEDKLYGYAGEDYILGGNRADKIFGGNGEDIIVGGWGWDKIYGEAGFDMLEGEQGYDVVGGGDDGAGCFSINTNDSNHDYYKNCSTLAMTMDDYCDETGDARCEPLTP